MDGVLRPGMRLVRRISLPAKFAVVTLLLLVPLAIGVGSGYAGATGQLRATERERAGLRLAAPLVQLVAQLAGARAAGPRDAAAPGVHPSPALPAVGDVDAAVAEVGDRLGVSGAWRQERADVLALTRAGTRAGTGPGTGTGTGAGAPVARALRGCIALLKEVADGSGLVADPRLDASYVATSLVTTLPRLLAAAGAPAATTPDAASARLERQLTARTLGEDAAQLADDVDTAVRATAWVPLDARLRPGVAAVAAAAARYTAAVEGRTPPAGSGTSARGLAPASSALAAQLAASLDTLLQHRQEELSAGRQRPVLLALGPLLALAYLLAALYRATSSDVRAVLEDISTVTNGQQPLAPLEGSDEFARMSRAVTYTRDRLTSLLGSLRYQATHDELTALGNRTLFTDKIDEALAAHGPGVAVVVVDLDRFRDVNDGFGHDMGDRLLRAVGARFHRACGRHDVVARLGSDEFGVLLTRGGGEVAALEVVARLRAALAPPVDVDGRLLSVRASFGVAVAGGDGRPAAELVRDADVALSAARDAAPSGSAGDGSPGRVAVFEPAMHERTRDRTELSADLVGAVERGELELHYQPIVDLGTEVVHGVEALARWNHPVRGLVPPTVFVPLAEATGTIVPIGRWVLREAVTQLARWRAEFAHAAPLTMEANLSAGQLDDPGLVPAVVALLLETGLDPRDLTLEITESALVEDLDAALRPLRQLSAAGVRLALDDFGTGYSSLTYLRRLPVGMLKIDRSFVADSDASEPARVLLAGISALGTGLGMRVVAEGVETERQAERVRAAGCHLGQGFLWARPMPAAAVTELLRRGGVLTPEARAGARAS